MPLDKQYAPISVYIDLVGNAIIPSGQENLEINITIDAPITPSVISQGGGVLTMNGNRLSMTNYIHSPAGECKIVKASNDGSQTLCQLPPTTIQTLDISVFPSYQEYKMRGAAAGINCSASALGYNLYRLFSKSPDLVEDGGALGKVRLKLGLRHTKLMI